MFKLPCMVSLEALHGSDWPWKRNTSGTSHRDNEPFVGKGPIGALQWPKTSQACQFKHEVCVRKIKTKKYYKIPEIYPVKTRKGENLGRMKSTGEPDVVKWFRKKVSLNQRTIFLFSIYAVIRIFTGAAVTLSMPWNENFCPQNSERIYFYVLFNLWWEIWSSNTTLWSN